MNEGPRYFGRRKGRPFRVRQEKLMATLMPQLLIALPKASSMLDPRALFDVGPEKITLEIGFGGGEHLAAHAENNPTAGYLGCEPFMNGVASLLVHIDSRKLKNIRMFPDDARLLIDVLKDQSIDECFVLYADPWPKTKHKDRRFMSPENLARLARVMKDKSQLHLATDDPTLAAWTHRVLQSSNFFAVTHEGKVPSPQWITTRYEQKALKAGRAPVYFTAEKLIRV